jgi:archaellum component FlaF (FlaF/FlaG flagellin family)
MKKKFGVFASICLFALLVAGGIYYFKYYNSIKEINIDGNFVTYDSEKELNDAADIILYGSPVNKFEDREHVNKKNADGVLKDFYTITKFKVKKILKNSTSQQININDLFNIIEPITLIQEIDGKKIIQIDSYNAMEESNKYIVYLKSNGNGGYSVINMSNGKFNMDKDEKTDDGKHMEIKNDIIKKYSKDIIG